MRCHNQELKLLFFTKKYWNILLMTIANINLSFLYYFGIFYWLNLYNKAASGLHAGNPAAAPDKK